MVDNMKSVSFLTLGCKVNQYESDGMAELLKANGYDVLPWGEKSDVSIVNTCAVTNIASRKSRQMLNRAKKINPDTVLVACGCYIQSVDDVLNTLPEVDIFLGNNQKNRIVEFLDEYYKNKTRQDHIIDINRESAYESFAINNTVANTRAYVKVQDGCNRFCTYCIIPYVRGRVRSRSMEGIVREVESLAASGYKEIVVTGIHVTSYGMDIEDDNINFLSLITRLNEIDGIERIRLGSLEPNVVTKEFVEGIVKLDKVCPHFHLSLQSGCDATLKRMNRHYTTEEYKRGVELLRDAYDNPAITTDVIVGFPGETDKEFEETYNYLQDINLYEMHVFPYSRRKGTKADTMSNQINGNNKHERSEKLRRLVAMNKALYEEKFMGKSVKVLVEEIVDIDGISYWVGHTERYVKVAIPIDDRIKSGDIVEVMLSKRLNDEYLLGESPV